MFVAGVSGRPRGAADSHIDTEEIIMSLLPQDHTREWMRSRLAEAERGRSAGRVAALRRAENRARKAQARLAVAKTRAY